MSLLTIKDDIGKLEAVYNRNLGESRVLQRRKEEIAVEIVSLSDTIGNLDEVLVILEKLTSETQEEFLGGIQKLISEGLSSVFGETINFKITPVTRIKQVTLDFTLENSDGTETPIIDARGGGLISLCGVLCRMIMVRLMRGRLRQILILDEPLAHLSREYLPAAGELLARLADELGIQIIAVSHQSEINEYADTVVRLSSGENGVMASVERSKA